MKYIYLIQSISKPARRYVGVTSDLKKRLADHNYGKNPHTADFRPWKIVAAVRFSDDKKATAFERYLKSGSGYAFANRHLW